MADASSPVGVAVGSGVGSGVGVAAGALEGDGDGVRRGRLSRSVAQRHPEGDGFRGRGLVGGGGSGCKGDPPAAVIHLPAAGGRPGGGVGDVGAQGDLFPRNDRGAGRNADPQRVGRGGGLWSRRRRGRGFRVGSSVGLGVGVGSGVGVGVAVGSGAGSTSKVLVTGPPQPAVLQACTRTAHLP